MTTVIAAVYIIFLLAMLAQGLATIYLNLYIWMDEDRLDSIRSPKKFSKPKTTFTILLPAYHEEAVLGDTIARVAKQKYPKSKYHILVILQPSDRGTYRVAREAIKKNKIKNAEILVVDGDHKPLNKPYQLNYALEHSTGDSLVIFDSEDEVHPDILNIANTLYIRKKVDIIQAGTQLMNYAKPWFASHNVLEYFFWWKSRIHAHIRVGSVPLGGNTVFFKTDQLRNVGGWNEHCLTEDGEIGLRLSLAGAKMFATYDAEHVTKEETPDSIEQFVKQRTRWVQGFIQILKIGYWKELPTRTQRLMALYLLGFPVMHALLMVTTPIFFAIGIGIELPFAISLLSFFPVMLVAMMMLIQLVGLYEFVREQNLPLKPHAFILMPITFIPYQFMLGAGAVRGAWRELRGRNNWEKTAHKGAHRLQPQAQDSAGA